MPKYFAVAQHGARLAYAVATKDCIIVSRHATLGEAEAEAARLNADAHSAALDYFEANGFSYEYPGFFMSPIDAERSVTCAFNWSGTGKWEAQVHREDGTSANGGDTGADFNTPEDVVAYRDSLKKQA